jgi:hypothetical protein
MCTVMNSVSSFKEVFTLISLDVSLKKYYNGIQGILVFHLFYFVCYRTCWKCGKKFIKEDGCNKMKCTCGALMCYICRQPVKDYSHFNGQGGDAYHK